MAENLRRFILRRWADGKGNFGVAGDLLGGLTESSD